MRDVRLEVLSGWLTERISGGLSFRAVEAGVFAMAVGLDLGGGEGEFGEAVGGGVGFFYVGVDGEGGVGVGWGEVKAFHEGDAF